MIKNYLTVVLALVGLQACNTDEQTGSTIESTIEIFRQALIEPNANTLEQLTSASLSYGHSSGMVEDKDEFIDALVSGKSNFLSIQITNQQITSSRDVSVVRHQLDAETEDVDRTRTNIRLHVLTIWRHEEGRWKLLTRQAVKIK
ncbi:MAG TPA: nuclear transport factor 2 family protein [Sphingobacterium sp.]|nr:nuclear transport factor 2 family protein [Sphingobacterium sp.]